MKYKIKRTAKVDSQIFNLILYVQDTFGKERAKEALYELENSINLLRDNPELGSIPRYDVLKSKGYRILNTKKNVIFYKINKSSKEITIYGVYDYKQDYINIIRGI